MSHVCGGSFFAYSLISKNIQYQAVSWSISFTFRNSIFFYWLTVLLPKCLVDPSLIGRVKCDPIISDPRLIKYTLWYSPLTTDHRLMESIAAWSVVGSWRRGNPIRDFFRCSLLAGWKGIQRPNKYQIWVRLRKQPEYTSQCGGNKQNTRFKLSAI